MNRHILIWMFFFTSLVSFSQDLKVEAIYYDNRGNPEKIEQKYFDNRDHSTLYVSHNNDNSTCIKTKEFKSKDTTIIEETYYKIFNEKTKTERLKQCDFWAIAANATGDTVKMTGYSSDKLIGDTLLTGSSIENIWNFSERIKNSRVGLILKNEIKIKLDSLIPVETQKTYYVKKLPIKVEIFDSEYHKKNIKHCEKTINKLIYKSYSIGNTIQLDAVDTIIWNKGMTKMRWSYTRFEARNTSISQYILFGKTLKIASSDSININVEFLNSKEMFQNIFVGRLVYSDVTYYIGLRYIDREKIVKEVSTNAQTTKNLYSLDSKSRIVEQRIYSGQELQRFVTYSYK